MQRVIEVSLNRNPWSIEQDAFARLETYLADAAARLAENPDREEILLDLEQAIADQCKQRMPPQASVISLQELLPALEAIGPVTVAQNPSASGAAAESRAQRPATPLQQDSQGAWVSGVCYGLATHLKLEVTLVRVIALVLLFATGGAMVLLYAILMLLLPHAELDPQRPAPRRIPAKLRQWTLTLRAKLDQHTR